MLKNLLPSIGERVSATNEDTTIAKDKVIAVSLNKTPEMPLIKIKGIGSWTAEMFLIFYLLRPNIFPYSDIGLQKAVSVNYNLKYPLKESEINKFKRTHKRPLGFNSAIYLTIECPEIILERQQKLEEEKRLAKLRLKVRLSSSSASIKHRIFKRIS